MILGSPRVVCPLGRHDQQAKDRLAIVAISAMPSFTTSFAPVQMLFG
jgi:hypothetical protein